MTGRRRRRGLTRRQAIVLRALHNGAQISARDLHVRSDVLWRLSERGLVVHAWGPPRSPDAQWRIQPAGVRVLDAYTSRQAGRLASRARHGQAPPSVSVNPRVPPPGGDLQFARNTTTGRVHILCYIPERGEPGYEPPQEVGFAE
jgi:hypothetical protein